MFYTNDPASDYDSYCEYLEQKNREWHEENDGFILDKIVELEMQLEDETDEDKIEDLEFEIKELKKELES